MSSPFADSTTALQAHHGFATAALNVGVHRISTAIPPKAPVSMGGQGCNKVVNVPSAVEADKAAPAAELPSERTRLECPHCERPSIIRSSRRMSKLTREIAYCCLNPECGHTFVAMTEIVRTLSPSATPDPSVHLPLSSHVRRDLLRAQMDYAHLSPHSPMFTKPVTGDLFAAGPPPAD